MVLLEFNLAPVAACELFILLTADASSEVDVPVVGDAACILPVDWVGPSPFFTFWADVLWFDCEL